MRRQSNLCYAIVLAALLPSCASTDSRSGGQGPSTEDLRKLAPGTTTTSEVRELLGPPVRVVRFDRMQRDVWEYRRYMDPMNEFQVAVQFSPDGIVREVLVLKDYTREPCGP